MSEEFELSMCDSPFAISFLAPPEPQEEDAAPASAPVGPRPPGVTTTAPAPASAAPRVTKQAREVLARLGVSDEELERALAAPDEVSQDERDASRMVFRRGSLVVVTGRDGAVIFVRRQGEQRAKGRSRPR